MAQIDKFIEALNSRGGDAVVIAADTEPAVVRGDQRLALSSRKPNAEQVRKLVAEIAPAEVRAHLVAEGRASFEYGLSGLPKMLVEVSDFRAATAVLIRPPVAEATAAAKQRPPAPPSAQNKVNQSKVKGRADQLEGLELERGETVKPAPVARPDSNSLDEPLDLDNVLSVVEPARPNVARAAQAAQPHARSHAVVATAGDKHPIDALFRLLVSSGSSDLHMSSGEVPMIRKDGEMERIEYPAQSSETLYELLVPIIPAANRQEFESDGDTDFAYEIAGLARFRANLFRDRKGVGAVFRTIPAEILTVDQLGLSKAIQDLCKLTKGLVLVTGPTGSGKSTTLCALVDLINRTRSDHIITIEDPIEFVHPNKKCLVNQREVRVHTQSFKRALRAALREDPDIVLVGELRDLETIAIAIETAETGHLVFGTLHTSTAYSTIDRIIDQFPPDRQEQIRVMLSESLRGVISQTLCKKIGGGRVAALEVLLSNPAVSNLIREGKTFQIPSIMQTNRGAGMVLLNEALLDLVQKQKITPQEAVLKAVDKTTLKGMLKNANIAFE